MKVALVYSGDAEKASPDNQDTWVQMQEITNHLRYLGHQVLPINFTASLGKLENDLKEFTPDWVFNLVETVGGSDEMLYLAASVFRFLNLPYTGCSDVTLAMLSSKLCQKKWLQLANLPTPSWVNWDGQVSKGAVVDGRWIVKSDSEHASVGLGSENVVASLEEARVLLQEKQREWGGRWFVEQYIQGREFNLSILDNGSGQPLVLPAAEIRFENFPADKPHIVDYEAKWNAESAAYQGTVRNFQFGQEDYELLQKLADLCCVCWEVFSLKGAARVDFRVDEDGNPWILEINANPCLSEDAGFMAASRQAGLTPIEVITNLLPRSKEKRV